MQMATRASNVRQLSNCRNMSQNKEYNRGSLIFEQIKQLLPQLPSVAIVILNWNGRHHLQHFLPSVLATTYSNYRLVVADNGSTDDSLSFIANSFPSVELIVLKKNLGFARGYNEALKGLGAEYCLLLNSDVAVAPGWLEPMISLLSESSNHAACQPKILSYKQNNLFEYAGACGGWIDGYGYPFSRGRVFDICEEDRGQYNQTAEVFWASGAALLIRTSVFDEMGGFDPFFFAHQEEIDLCWRMKQRGYQIFCCPQSVVYHVGGGTLPRGHSRKTFLNFRNNQIMLWKNLPWREKWWKVPFRILLDWISGLKGLISGDGGYLVSILKGHLGFAGWLLHKRQPGQGRKRRSLKTFSGVYLGNIAWQHFIRKCTTFSEIVKN